MLVLHETPLGYGIFRTKPLEVERMVKYDSLSTAVEEMDKIARGSVPEILAQELLKMDVEYIGVTNQKLAEGIEKKLKEENKKTKVKTGEEVEETGRKIHSQLAELLSISEKEMSKAYLALAHAVSRNKLKMTPSKLDLVLVQSVKALDKLDKDINNKCMRMREWHGLYMPELSEMISDNRRYISVLYEYLNKGRTTDELQEQIEEAKNKTIGSEIAEEDRALLESNAESVLQMYEAREKLQEHMRKRMAKIAPNTQALIGEYLGAKLIEHAGSLSELASKPASTIQIMGAEASLFKTLKEKQPTPKYGYIYNSSYVGQVPYDAKGLVARTLAAKIALACRCDMAEEDETGEYGQKLKAAIERRIEQIAQKKRTKRKEPARTSSTFTFKRPAPQSSTSAHKRKK